MTEEYKIVEILPTKIWWDKDMWGTVHIKMQHEGMYEFTFIKINYNYAYTDNAHQRLLADQIVRILKGEE